MKITTTFILENFIPWYIAPALINIILYIAIGYFVLRNFLLAIIVIPLMVRVIFYGFNMWIAYIIIALLFTIKKMYFEDFFKKFDLIYQFKNNIEIQ